MQVRMLWVPPGSDLACGEIYDLAADQAAHLIASGEAEALAPAPAPTARRKPARPAGEAESP
jgi:hypothetical protein